MVDLVYCSTDLLLFDIPLLHYYVNLRSSVVFYLSSGNIYLSLGIFVSLSTVCDKVFEICNFICSFITNQITSSFCCFLNCFFEAVLSASVADC